MQTWRHSARKSQNPVFLNVETTRSMPGDWIPAFEGVAQYISSFLLSPRHSCARRNPEKATTSTPIWHASFVLTLPPGNAYGA